MISFQVSNFKTHLTLFGIALILLGCILVGINRFIESKKTDFKQSEPTTWESIQTYKDMIIK
jgi:hypothetical protein